MGDLASTRSNREELYKYFHQHPELSMQERGTADRIVQELEASGISTTRIGETGVLATIENGAGPTVAMRADIDALPVKEVSGKDYASTATQLDEKSGTEVPVAHACGHDFHLMSLITALQAFNAHKDEWSGTFIGVFQPAEETAEGARAMLDADLKDVIPRGCLPWPTRARQLAVRLRRHASGPCAFLRFLSEGCRARQRLPRIHARTWC